MEFLLIIVTVLSGLAFLMSVFNSIRITDLGNNLSKEIAYSFKFSEELNTKVETRLESLEERAFVLESTDKALQEVLSTPKAVDVPTSRKAKKKKQRKV